MERKEMTEPKYSIEVYEDHAIITGWLTSDILKFMIRLCKEEGFTHLVPNDGKQGFKLVRKDEMG